MPPEQPFRRADDVCAAHSGQEEKMNGLAGKVNLIVWLVGSLIGLMVTSSGAIYVQVAAMNVTLASYVTKYEALQTQINRLESTDQKMWEHINKIEYRR